MATRDGSDRMAVLAATAASAAMVAFQLGGKATRDAYYLTTFGVASLPAMLIAAAFLSALLTIGLSRVMSRVGPARLIPALFGASALLLLGEWILAGRSARLVAVLFYLHYSAIGALLISGFWTLVTERFDPRAAKGTMGRITAGASIGGLVGGLLPERLSAVLPLTGMFPILAALHLLAALLVLRVRPPGGAAAPAARPAEAAGSARRALGRSPYLRDLALLVLLSAMAEGLLDWSFKARAVTVVSTGGELLQFFARFYTATALLGVILQVTALRGVLARLGLARSAALLPAGVSLGALGGLLLPGIGPVLAARGTESVLRHSVFRGAYELLFAPVPPGEKRATKLLVDVGATRLGDLAAALLIQLALLVASALAGGLVLAATLAVALAALLVARRLHAGYPGALARSLALRAGPVPTADQDAMATLVQTAGGFDLGILRAAEQLRTAQGGAATPGPATAASPVPDAPLDRAAALASRSAATVERALTEAPLPPELVEAAIGLLAWDPVAPAAGRALLAVADRELAALTRHLLDPGEDFAIRRRLVRVLAACSGRAAWDALIRALDDPRFEVRYRAGRALYRLSQSGDGLRIGRERVLAAVLNEVQVGRGVWESRQLIDAADDEASPLEAEVVRDRANRSLEHVFTLLALDLPREPLRLAFHGLHTDDRHLRGTALEYLESVLPDEVRTRLWPFLEPEGQRRTSGARRPDEALDLLLRSRDSIVLALAEVRRKAEGG